MNSNWTAADMPGLQGKTAIVTGGNSGVGFYTALELARAGAYVVIGSRNEQRGKEDAAQMKRLAPGIRVGVDKLNLADLASVEAFAGRMEAELAGVDILVNNAGVMAVPKRELTAQGFEMHFGTNHLGHFALTGWLLPLLQKSRGRVITVSAMSSRAGRLGLDDLNFDRRYGPMRAYNRSKLANVMFALELDRRLRHTGILSAAVHPGTSMTGIQRNVPKALTGLNAWLIDRWLGQSADRSALPSLYAASMPEVRGGMFYGPTGRFELKGPPGPVELPKRALEPGAAAELWEVSAALTGVRYGGSASKV